MHESYPYPPIIEAVIEVRVDGLIDEADRLKVGKKLSKFYPTERLQVNKTINVDLDHDTASINPEGMVITRANGDENEQILLGPNSLSVSQRATYPGWAKFFTRFQRDWTAWKSVIGHRKVIQIGMRYINRIDVPLVDHVARHEDYLTLQIQLPPSYPNTSGYSLMARLPLSEVHSFAVINSGAVESPIPGYAGFLLDIDVIRQVDVPQNDTDIKGLLEKMRHAKNNVFQSLITDAARDRFRNDEHLR
jgi:uncharacterized protein (TIGR04255 family)